MMFKEYITLHQAPHVTGIYLFFGRDKCILGGQ